MAKPINQIAELSRLWTPPITASSNPDYGTNRDFALLLSEAHRRGIRVIVDFVMNHTVSDHPWFVDSRLPPLFGKAQLVRLERGESGLDPTLWAAIKPGIPKTGRTFYGIFWEGMPDLNYRNAGVRKEMNTIASYWLNQGVDGFRLMPRVISLKMDREQGRRTVLRQPRILERIFSACAHSHNRTPCWWPRIGRTPDHREVFRVDRCSGRRR